MHARFLSAIFLLPLPVHAGISAHYSLAPDAVDSGGLPGASPTYALNASAMPGGPGSSPTYGARTGYAGQLEDAAALAGYLAWIQAALPAGLPAAAYQEASDYDRDGATNYDEWLALTNPASGSSRFVPTSTLSGASAILSFPSATGRSYRLRQSDTLTPVSWINAPAQSVLTGTGGILTFTVPWAGVPRRFYQIQPQLP